MLLLIYIHSSFFLFSLFLFYDTFVWLYLLQGLQGVRVYFCDEVGFCYGIEILTNRINIHQAVVCHFNALEVREKPAKILHFTQR